MVVDSLPRVAPIKLFERPTVSSLDITAWQNRTNVPFKTD